MVMMCTGRRLLMYSTIDARVVDLPEPVVPVMMMIPRRSSESSSIISGRFRSSNERILSGTNRSAAARVPCWRKMFTRNRPVFPY